MDKIAETKAFVKKHQLLVAATTGIIVGVVIAKKLPTKVDTIKLATTLDQLKYLQETPGSEMFFPTPTAHIILRIVPE